jgi:hypothetical protein
MKPLVFVLMLCVNFPLFTDETDDTPEKALPPNNSTADEYYDFRIDEGITIYTERVSDPVEDFITGKLNGTLKEREEFIEEDFLTKAGFRRTGSVKFRPTTESEKAFSILHGVTHAFSLGILPMTPFFEEDYARLPQGEFYHFESVMRESSFKDVSFEVRTVMELEYMLQFAGSTKSGLLKRSHIDHITKIVLKN